MKRKATATPKPDASESPPAAAAGSMRKHKPHKPHVRWSDAEERMLLDAVNAHIAANGGLWNAVKTDPVLGARSRAGVKAHWESMCRRMFDGRGNGKHSDEDKASTVEKTDEE